jgi:hypothetical protein
MSIDFDLTKYQAKLTQIAQQADKPFKRPTGALQNSIRVEITGTEQGELISIKFNEYGLYVDAGVEGAFGTKHQSGKGYNKKVFKYEPITKVFKRKGGQEPKEGAKARPVPVGGSLYFGARVNIRKFGIPARPWIQNMLTALQQELEREITNDLPPIIENKITELLAQLK